MLHLPLHVVSRCMHNLKIYHLSVNYEVVYCVHSLGADYDFLRGEKNSEKTVCERKEKYKTKPKSCQQNETTELNYSHTKRHDKFFSQTDIYPSPS